MRYATLATAALLLVIVSAGLLTLNTGQQQTTLQATADVPEIYEDIDFYLWLADQQDKESEDDNATANST